MSLILLDFPSTPTLVVQDEGQTRAWSIFKSYITSSVYLINCIPLCIPNTLIILLPQTSYRSWLFIRKYLYPLAWSLRSFTISLWPSTSTSLKTFCSVEMSSLYALWVNHETFMPPCLRKSSLLSELKAFIHFSLFLCPNYSGCSFSTPHLTFLRSLFVA